MIDIRVTIIFTLAGIITPPPSPTAFPPPSALLPRPREVPAQPPPHTNNSYIYI